MQPPFADLCAKALAKILKLPPTFFIKCDRAIGTLFQLFLPATNGGAALPDPLLLRRGGTRKRREGRTTGKQKAKGGERREGAGRRTG